MARKSSSSRSGGGARGRSFFGGSSAASQKSIVPVSRPSVSQSSGKPLQNANLKNQPTPSLFSTFASSAAGAVAGNALSNMLGSSGESIVSSTSDSLQNEDHRTSSTAQSIQHPCAFEINQFIFCAENNGQYSCGNQWENFEQCHRQNPSWF